MILQGVEARFDVSSGPFLEVVVKVNNHKAELHIFEWSQFSDKIEMCDIYIWDKKGKEGIQS